MDGIQNRKCTADDLVDLKEISISTFLDTYAHLNTSENVEKHLKHAFNDEQLLSEILDPEIAFYFFYNNQELCGYIKLCWGRAQSEVMVNEYVEVERIYVVKAHHRKGIGRYMIDLARSKTKKLKKSKLWLGVWKKNPEAVEFYKKVGFKIFGEHTFTVGNDVQSDWMMELDI